MGTYDTQAIKDLTNLVDLVSQTITLQRVSGEEWAGPCPKCGGEDRFHVSPSMAFCRQCGPSVRDCRTM